MEQENLIFLDVETTGLEDEDRLCEVAYEIEGLMMEEQFKPPLPIKFGAMAVSHITNDMVAKKPTFEGSEMQQELNEYNVKNFVMVAHNAPFDLEMLEKDGATFNRVIDTKKLSHKLDRRAISKTEIDSQSDPGLSTGFYYPCGIV